MHCRHRVGTRPVGDGVYVCRSEDVDLRWLDVRDHYHQGFSVISARRLYVGQSRFNDTRGTPPACGIDFEPNEASDYLFVPFAFRGNRYENSDLQTWVRETGK